MALTFPSLLRDFLLREDRVRAKERLARRFGSTCQSVSLQTRGGWGQLVSLKLEFYEYDIACFGCRYGQQVWWIEADGWRRAARGEPTGLLGV